MKKQTLLTSLLALILLFSIAIPQQALAIEKLFYFFNNTYGLTNFKKNSKEIDVVAPQIYTVGYDLKVKKPKSATLKISKDLS